MTDKPAYTKAQRDEEILSVLIEFEQLEKAGIAPSIIQRKNLLLNRYRMAKRHPYADFADMRKEIGNG